MSGKTTTKERINCAGSGLIILSENHSSLFIQYDGREVARPYIGISHWGRLSFNKRCKVLGLLFDRVLPEGLTLQFTNEFYKQYVGVPSFSPAREYKSVYDDESCAVWSPFFSKSDRAPSFEVIDNFRKLLGSLVCEYSVAKMEPDETPAHASLAFLEEFCCEHKVAMDLLKKFEDPFDPAN